MIATKRTTTDNQSSVCGLKLYADMALEVLHKTNPMRNLLINADGPAYATIWARRSDSPFAIIVVEPTWIQIIEYQVPRVEAEMTLADAKSFEPPDLIVYPGQ